MVDLWGFASWIVCLRLTERYYENHLVCPARLAVAALVLFHGAEATLWFYDSGLLQHNNSICSGELLGCVSVLFSP